MQKTRLFRYNIPILTIKDPSCHLTGERGRKQKTIAGETENCMKSYVCIVCGYVYDPEENGGVPFEELPEDWVCPMCGVGKDQFEEE